LRPVCRRVWMSGWGIIGWILPMPFGTALQMTPVKLMNALRGDNATLFAGQCAGNFPPGPTPLALFPDKIHERFKPAVKGASAASALSLHRLAIVDDVWIHQRTV
jgi:hypothetical protein